MAAEANRIRRHLGTQAWSLADAAGTARAPTRPKGAGHEQ
jgi:hypothetical protein